MKIRKVVSFTLPFFVVLLGLPLIFASCATVGIEKVQYDVVMLPFGGCSTTSPATIRPKNPSP
ncbi:MAG: hypothetical protein ACYSO0_05225 [Planctomycetota bacterium]